MDGGKQDTDTSICLLRPFEYFLLRYSADYNFRCDPFPECQWQVKVYAGIPDRHPYLPLLAYFFSGGGEPAETCVDKDAWLCNCFFGFKRFQSCVQSVQCCCLVVMPICYKDENPPKGLPQPATIIHLTCRYR